MKNSTKHIPRNSIFRILFVGISVLGQVLWLLLLILRLNRHSLWISILTGFLAVIAVLRIHSHHTNTALKTPWIMLILSMPVMGLSLYILFETLGNPRTVRKRLLASREAPADDPEQDLLLRELSDKDRTAANQFRYLQNQGNPLYRNTRADYYPESKLAFQSMKEDLQKAERFIFMEYFILADGVSFGELRQILRERAAAGVEVRILYDDFGSIGSANLHFARDLSKDGIRCQVFNPAVPVMNLFMNHRDHRKITVIDGKVGYTGGYNLSDEYFDITRPYGHWKDLGLRLEGEAVAGLTRIFLELWRFSSRQQEAGAEYLRTFRSLPEETGCVQPYGDSPVGPERIAENVYLNMVNGAREYIWFMTPYLIITDEMVRALQLAAKRGIDVRIITPGIPDKKMVYSLTRSYYSALVRHGVRIFEYTPGFCHGKLCVCDGNLASIGTSNLDYRSLYLHFENNVLLYDCQAVRDMAGDLRGIFPQCREVTADFCSRSGIFRLWQSILRLFAPLM